MQGPILKSKCTAILRRRRAEAFKHRFGGDGELDGFRAVTTSVDHVETGSESVLPNAQKNPVGMSEWRLADPGKILV